MNSKTPPVKRTLLLLTVLAIAAGGWALYSTRPSTPPKSELPPEAVQALQESQQMTLYSIDPDPQNPHSPGDGLFHGYGVLGHTDVSNSAARQRVAREIQQAVAASDGVAYMCFNPRHGVRVTRGSTTFDFLICFECEAIYTFVGDVRIDATALHGSGTSMNDILRAAKISIAPSHDE